jgi:hypothetical protein
MRLGKFRTITVLLCFALGIRWIEDEVMSQIVSDMSQTETRSWRTLSF